MEQAAGTAQSEGDIARISVTAMVPLPRQGVVAQACVQLLDLRDERGHFVHGIIAALRCAGVARPAPDVDLDLHPPAMATIHPEVRRLRQDHAICPDSILFQYVDPRQAVAVFFLYGSDHVQRVVGQEASSLISFPA